MDGQTPHDPRLERAATALLGLSIGDGLGGFFEFSGGRVAARVRQRAVPEVQWRWTDDTQMALSLFAVLRQHGQIEQEAFARSMASRYERGRGYGMATRATLKHLRQGGDWRDYAPALFQGQGSCGNGAASRVPPLGAYFADDLERTVGEAQRSSLVTHAHPEAVAGAIAVAVASALAAADAMDAAQPPAGGDFLGRVIAWVPDSQVREGLQRARELGGAASAGEAARLLGNGSAVTAQTSVPFALWCAAARLGSYEEALWLALEGQGDCDTIGAIVGGVVASATGTQGIPSRWRALAEPLPRWAFEQHDGA